jgi:hypothetical protein
MPGEKHEGNQDIFINKFLTHKTGGRKRISYPILEQQDHCISLRDETSHTQT